MSDQLPESDDLPRRVARPEAPPTGGLHGLLAQISRLPRRWLLLVPVIMVVMMTGAVIGIYFQPPGLKAIVSLTGLKPGGGTDTPIAVAVDPSVFASTNPDEDLTPANRVVGLGRLLPEGDVIVIAPPYGAGDARIAEMRVRDGDRVELGETMAVLDNARQLQSALESATATVAVREASLVQIRDATRASLDEARASLATTQASAEVTRLEFDRKQTLFDRGVVTKSALDTARADYTRAKTEVERARATVSRYANTEPDVQADVQVAIRNLEAAHADLQRAQHDLQKAFVIAPIAGTVLDINARPGEKPGAEGILNLGNIDRMMAEIEVYQSQIGMVKIGNPVEISATALSQPLYGRVVKIGLEVGRQTVIGDDPAANTDARVVKVMVALEAASSDIASRFTNLEVVARIASDEQSARAITSKPAGD